MSKKICPDCNKETMFKNQVGSFTCSNKKCGRVVFSLSAEKHIDYLNLINNLEKQINILNSIIHNQDKMINIYSGDKK